MPTSLLDMESTASKMIDSQQQQQLISMAMNLMMIKDSSEENSPTNVEWDYRRRSQNMTECVPVPSSEHVAEIVGRQGCKIKALRAKTNTYIKTPVRGEEPVFVVTGRKEDVFAAKNEIQSAADHFSNIRAQRKNNVNGMLVPGPNSNIPGQTTIQVKVPYRVVGLVVGPKGATIKKIQQNTNTYIVTPSREKSPTFEVTGLPENVESARIEIESHIASRTQGQQIIDNAMQETNLNYEATTTYMNNMNEYNCRQNFSLQESMWEKWQGMSENIGKNGWAPGQPSQNVFANTNGMYIGNRGMESPVICDTQRTYGISSWPEVNRNPMLESGSSPTSDVSLLSAFDMSTIYSEAARIPTSSPPQPANFNTDEYGHASPMPFITSFSPLTATTAFPYSAAQSRCTSNSSGSPQFTPTISNDALAPGTRKPEKRDCSVCFESEVVAALVPCGHNKFCMECAQRTVKTRQCTICYQPVTQAIRIYN
ncbi:RNA-binding protein MEX3B [Caerostris darwini]|uniref:RNA-binding protein MEX3B n=1 Tax=Caerostris darwini TaxID=1538125 RepID=A0AAV4ST40_9ARAC|nr:RNA-binding protein MEX3B [Caerostris darwini]